jgi:hypothetical protein
MLLAGCQAEVPLDGSRPLLDVMEAVPEVSRMRAAIRRAGLDEMLSGPGPFTVFAPSNTVWASLPAPVRDGNADAIRSFIAHNRMLTPGLAMRREQGIRMITGTELRLVGGTPDLPRLQVAREGQPQGASASVTRANILASNGVLHVIDGVLLPSA